MANAVFTPFKAGVLNAEFDLNTATITRPNTGTTVRPATGTITRPDSGIVERP